MHPILGESNINGTLHCINLQFQNQESVVDANAKRDASGLFNECICKTRGGIGS